MQDLNTINAKNTEAFNNAVQAARNNGHYVVLEKAGLAVVGFKAYSDATAAATHAEAYAAQSPDAAAEIITPAGA